jgi:hypothetical protein
MAHQPVDQALQHTRRLAGQFPFPGGLIAVITGPLVRGASSRTTTHHPLVPTADGSVGWGQARWGEGKWGGVEHR